MYNQVLSNYALIWLECTAVRPFNFAIYIEISGFLWSNLVLSSKLVNGYRVENVVQLNF